MQALVNGRPDGCIPLGDRGLAYGDGLFETLAVSGGQIRLWDAHLARLARGCRVLGLPVPDPDLLRAEAESLMDGQESCVLKIVLTRGGAGRGYASTRGAPPTRILQRHPWPGPAFRGVVRARLCTHRLSSQPRLAGIKHLNRLDQVLARAEWDDPRIAEGLMQDLQGRVVEGVSSNLFLVRAGRLETPALRDCGVAGVVRALTLRMAGDLGIPWAERDLHLEDLHDAEALFLTNSIRGILPLAYLEDRAYDPAAIPPALADGVRAAALGEGA